MHEIARYLYIVFFAVHIPTSLLVDAQAVLPASWFPRAAQTMLQNFIQDYKDPLMSPPRQTWFLSLIWTELLFQVPCFFILLYGFIFRKEWIRVPAAIYGGFVCATMVPILTELYSHQGGPDYKRNALLAMYAPYLLVPGILAIHMMTHPSLLFGTRMTGKHNEGFNKKKKL